MLYLLAILLPPCNVLLCGKPLQAILKCVLCLFLWIPGIIHACFVVSGHKADQRTDRIVTAMQQGARA